MECYNIKLLQRLFDRFCGGQIVSLQQWHTFLEFLYINQLIEPKDLLKIKDSIIYYPVVFENLLKIFANSNLVTPLTTMSKSLDKLYNQVNDCRTALKNWNFQTFSIEDLIFTTKTYEEILQEFEDLKKEFDDFTYDVLIVNQPIQSLKAQVASFKIEEINPKQYQTEQRDKTEKEFQKIRIKSVQYRNQPIKILKQFDSQIRIQVGFDQIKDSPIEVWMIPKKMWKQEDQAQALQTFEAHHELILSKQLPNYLGQDLLSDENYFQHFMELTRGNTMRYLLKNKQKNPINPDMPFFRIAMKQIFQGFYDILRMTKYQPILPLTLMNIQVSQEGLKIYLKNVRFSGLKNENDDSLEATLLENYAQIVMSTLGLQRNQVGLLVNNLPWKNLLEGLFNAEEDHKLFKKNVIQNKLSFCQLLGHDLFDDELISHFEIQDIIANYHYIFQG
ncbi:hypothetical protein pb186bvf_016716 [Paramecium bursaria]